MSEAMEALEHAEHASHAAHGGDHGKAPAKLIGLTMALIGVMIAFCAAMVGGERNELTRTMIEQTQANADASSASIKFRLIMLELEKQRGVPATAAAATASPSPVLPRFMALYNDYSKERKVSKEWADSYGPMIQAHFEGAEGYEHAQLIAEIGIVLASLGVLLSSRPAWFISLVFAAVCVVQLGRTFVHTRTEVNEASEKVHVSDEAYHELRKAHASAGDDERTVEALDPGGVMRRTQSGSATGDQAAGKAQEQGEK
jgi:hypothetical protein